MRNIDYAALYQQVLESERRGTWDGLTHDERTAKEINSNKARRISVNQAKMGKGTGKRGVAPVAPPNLMQDHVDAMCDRLISEGFATDYESAIGILEVCSDEWFNLLLDEQITAGKNFNSSGLDLRTTDQKMKNIKGSVKQNDKIQGLIQPPKGL